MSFGPLFPETTVFNMYATVTRHLLVRQAGNIAMELASCLKCQPAGVVMVGFAAAISLLLRHWGAIERYTQATAQPSLTAPLLQVCRCLCLCDCLVKHTTACLSMCLSACLLLFCLPLCCLPAVMELWLIFQDQHASNKYCGSLIRRYPYPNLCLIHHR